MQVMVFYLRMMKLPNVFMFSGFYDLCALHVHCMCSNLSSVHKVKYPISPGLPQSTHLSLPGVVFILCIIFFTNSLSLCSSLFVSTLVCAVRSPTYKDWYEC